MRPSSGSLLPHPSSPSSYPVIHNTCSLASTAGSKAPKRSIDASVPAGYLCLSVQAACMLLLAACTPPAACPRCYVTRPPREGRGAVPRKGFSRCGTSQRACWPRWAAVPKEDWPEAEAQRAIILSDFAQGTPYGDRRQARIPHLMPCTPALAISPMHAGVPPALRPVSPTLCASSVLQVPEMWVVSSCTLRLPSHGIMKVAAQLVEPWQACRRCWRLRLLLRQHCLHEDMIPLSLHVISVPTDMCDAAAACCRRLCS